MQLEIELELRTIQNQEQNLRTALIDKLQLYEKSLAGKGRGKLPSLPIQLILRNNRVTMARIQYHEKPVPGWILGLARSLLLNFELECLPLCKIMLCRARGLKPPVAWKSATATLQQNWSRVAAENHKATPAKHLPSDKSLHCALLEVSQLCSLKPPARGIPDIAWNSSSTARILGRYQEQHNQILIHQALNNSSVPPSVLRSLIHHEYLHAVLGSKKQGSKVVHHHREFRTYERRWPDYVHSTHWFEKNWSIIYKAWKSRS